MRKERSESRKLNDIAFWKKRTILIAGMVLIALIMIWSVTTTVQKSLKQDQMRTLDTVAHRITRNMRNNFNLQWDYLAFVEQNMSNYHYRTGEEVLRVLNFEKKVINHTEAQNTRNMMFLIDSDGFYHSSARGKISLWHCSNTVFSFSSVKEGCELSMSALTDPLGETNDYLCFVKKLDQPLVAADGSCFTHMILAADESIFDIDLSLSEFGKLKEVLVIDGKGRIISSQTEDSTFSDSYNLFTALKKAEVVLGDSLETMKKSVADRRNGSTMIRMEDNEFYINYQYMGIEDWTGVYLVDKADMASEIGNLAYHLVALLSVGFLLMIGLVVLLLLLYSRETLARERVLHAQLVETAEAADQANQAKSVFLSRMSHDIRTPINGIMGMVKIAEATIDDPASVKTCLKKITSSSEHLAEMVNEVLEISRIESGKTEVRIASVNLRAILEQMGDIIESKLLDKSLAYEIDDTGVTHPWIMGDGNLIKQVLINLLGNAVKYTPDGGRIACTVYEKALEQELTAEYHFIIEDTGIGMKPEFLEHIFDRFAQEHADARTTYEGSGLGMSITHEFVELMGGTIQVESEVGKGSRFEIVLTFPYIEKDNWEQEQEQAYHVLVAEDNEINCTIVKFMLTQSGHTCEIVPNGQALVQRFEASAPGEFDAIMTDIRMPVMDGLTATAVIRAMNRHDAKTIPILAMTANAYQEDQDKSMAAGMNDHLTKPLEAEQVLSALQRHCRKGQKDEKENT